MAERRASHPRERSTTFDFETGRGEACVHRRLEPTTTRTFELITVVITFEMTQVVRGLARFGRQLPNASRSVWDRPFDMHYRQN